MPCGPHFQQSLSCWNTLITFSCMTGELEKSQYLLFISKITTNSSVLTWVFYVTPLLGTYILLFPSQIHLFINRTVNNYCAIITLNRLFCNFFMQFKITVQLFIFSTSDLIFPGIQQWLYLICVFEFRRSSSKAEALNGWSAARVQLSACLPSKILEAGQTEVNTWIKNASLNILIEFKLLIDDDLSFMLHAMNAMMWAMSACWSIFPTVLVIILLWDFVSHWNC